VFGVVPTIRTKPGTGATTMGSVPEVAIRRSLPSGTARKISRPPGDAVSATRAVDVSTPPTSSA
jgi:hypothetical protein